MRKELPFVQLRAMEPTDIDLIYKVENDVTVWKDSNTNSYYSKFFIRDFIERSTGDIYTDKQVRLIAMNADNIPVAVVDIQDFSPSNLRAEVGLVVLKEYRGMGYGTACVQQLIDYARGILHLHQLYVYINKENTGSICLFRSMGFQTCGTLHDWLFNGSSYHDVELLQVFL